MNLFSGIEFFFELLKKQGIEFPYESIEDYVINTYSDGAAMYEKLLNRYECEIKEYHGKEKSFEELFGRLVF